MPSTDNRPLLSVVLIVYRMPRQAMNTLRSLAAGYQRDVSVKDYEVLVIENESPEMLRASEVEALGPNFFYHRRQESRPTPVYAINYGVEQARSDNICLMVDGARMLTPRVIKYTLLALKMDSRSIVAVPGYHLGEQDQRWSESAGHTEDHEAALLEGINWHENGYRLFDISVISGANTHGCFHPLMECNCLTVAKDSFLKTGGAHEGFQSPGGGSVNLDIYRNIALLPESQLVVLAGEGSFHQFHGGVTTREQADIEALWAGHREEFKSIRGEYYQAVLREPTIFGSISSHAMPYLLQSSRAGQKRFKRFEFQGEDPWRDDHNNQTTG